MTTKQNAYPLPGNRPAHPRDITINVQFTTDGQMQFNISRTTNPLELAAIANAIVGSQIEMMAKASVTSVPVRDRTKPHDYESNQSSVKSMAGEACGLCGKPIQDLIHAEQENEAGDGQ